ncbi:MAG TPA: alpha/beta hydrolase [Kofleriaceae bacterium]|nr:alpha/beta hydrolase [Kofleriaceae bacterium]
MRAVVAQVVILAGLFASPASAQKPGGLARRADWQARVSEPGSGPWAEVVSVEPGSAAARAGLRAGDRITRMDGVRVDSPSRFGDARRASRAGVPVRLSVTRGRRSLPITFAPRAVPLESEPGLEIVYDAVTGRLGRQRVIITRPARATGKLPSLILVPWLSCSSVEVLGRPADGMNRLLAGILRESGFLTMRVERPGVGDSQGACSRADLAAEMAGERAALARLQAHPSFDPDRLFVVGMSLGGGRAPLLASGVKVRGFVSVVGVVKTWFEHMMEIERRRLVLSGKPPAEVNRAMRGYATLYAEYLNRGKTPGRVVRENPRLAPLWEDEPAHQYGRPAAYYQQVQALDLEAAWHGVSAPTLIVAGDYDWIMSQDDHDRIAELVNRNRPGAATLVRWPRASHELKQYRSRKAAFDDEGGTFDDALIARVVGWMKQQARARRTQ